MWRRLPLVWTSLAGYLVGAYLEGWRRWRELAQRSLEGPNEGSSVIESIYREADLGGTKLGPRMGVGIF